MNKINFQLKDKEKINLSIGMGIKEIYPPIENLEVTPSNEEQIFTHENSYGYDKVTVNAIPDNYIEPSGTLEITENGTYNVKEYEQATVEVEGSGGDSNLLYKPRFISFYDYRGSELDAELASLDTSELTKIDSMFNGCIGLTSLDLSNHNLSNATSMIYFCNGCAKLKTIKLPKLYKVSDFNRAFYSCSVLTSIDLSDAGRDTKITNIDSMFRNCNYLTSVNMDNFNASGVTQPTTLFYGCYSLASLDLSTMKLGTITSISTMFYNCRALTHLDIRNFDFTSVTNTNNAFYNVPTDCEIIVADDTQKQWFATKFSTLTNVKTVAEYEAG